MTINITTILGVTAALGLVALSGYLIARRFQASAALPDLLPAPADGQREGAPLAGRVAVPVAPQAPAAAAVPPQVPAIPAVPAAPQAPAAAAVPPPALPAVPPAIVVGPRSQFNIRGGEGACGTCSVVFAVALLRNLPITPDLIDRLLEAAVTKHGEIVRARYGEDADPGRYLSFDEVLRYSNLGQYLDIVNDPAQIRQATRLEYGYLLDALVGPRKRAGLLTIRPYSMTVQYDPASPRPWSLFDSHGGGGIGANLQTFANQQALVAHLERDYGYIQLEDDHDEAVVQARNMCSLEPVTLLPQ